MNDSIFWKALGHLGAAVAAGANNANSQGRDTAPGVRKTSFAPIPGYGGPGRTGCNCIAARPKK